MKETSIKVFGIGGAGCNAVDFMARERAADNLSATSSFVALNTDSQSLDACAVPEKFCLGIKLTHGLGVGGDPDMGRAAAEADTEQLRELCSGANVIFIVAGLGGGTGTGASPVIAQLAKDAGALVLGIVVTPFDFEGGRRHRQAQFGLQQLKSIADAVICLPNENVFKLIDEKTTVLDTFKIANRFLAQGVNGISRLLSQTGLINVDFSDLCSVTRQLHSTSSFATAEASGENRVQQVLEKLFTHPMLGDGELLEESSALLVSVAGGTDLGMAEVNRVMSDIKYRCENAHIIFGASIDESLANSLSVTLVASGSSRQEEKNRDIKTVPANASVDSNVHLLNSKQTPRPASRVVAPAPELSPERKEQLLSKQTRGKKQVARMRQNELPLEIISKGRFEKSEPTIHRGEDLDLPTYIRRGIPLN